MAKAGNLGHLRRIQELPAHESVLTAGVDALLPLAPAEQQRLAAVAIEGGGSYVLSTREAVLSSAWFHLIERCRRLGRRHDGYFTVEPLVLELLAYEEGGGADTARERAARLRDGEVIESLMAESRPLEWFRKIVASCHALGASDIHVEVREAEARVRVRRDGVMRQVMQLPAQVAIDGLSASYTVLAEERSRSEVAFNALVPQAAMIPLELGDEKLHLRYQSHPVVGGLDATLRILRVSAGARSELLDLDALGYLPAQAEALRLAAASASGGVFVAGVTGSGKTTTLNALLRALAREDNRKIVSIEDPVEYVVDGVSHFSVQRSPGSDAARNPFSQAMLAFLRMDPDVGLFGEIRDNTSAQMAEAAIQTGHKILTTVHATSALGIVARLSSQAIGLTREALCAPDFISALVYQVLVPINCPDCSRPAEERMPMRELGLYESVFGLDIRALRCASDQGCPRCRVPGLDASGGRNGVRGVKVGAEVLLPDEALLGLLASGDDLGARRYWRQQRTSGFHEDDMRGKEAWGHVLRDLAQGHVDPFFFERTFGSPLLLREAAQPVASRELASRASVRLADSRRAR